MNRRGRRINRNCRCKAKDKLKNNSWEELKKLILEAGNGWLGRAKTWERPRGRWRS
jgi:hypothetical protein